MAFLKGVERGDVTRLDILFYEIHDGHPRLFCKPSAGGGNGGNGPVPRESQSEGLGDAVHGVRRKHAGTGTAPRTGAILQFAKPLPGQRPRLDPSYALEHIDQVDGITVMDSRHHGPSAYHHGGNIETQRRHKHARHYLVAVRHKHKTVEGMGRGHDFDGIGDQLPAGQGIFHAGVAHGDAVTDADRGKCHRRSACHSDSRLHILRNSVEMYMAGNNFVGRIYYPDYRPGQLFVGIAHGLEERSVRRSLKTLFHKITSHFIVLFCVVEG